MQTKITFVARDPNCHWKNGLITMDVELDKLTPAAYFIATHILTTEAKDDMSLIDVEGPSPRERDNDPEELEMMDRNFPGYADRRELIPWNWRVLRKNETPESYFETQAYEMRRIGGLAIVARNGERFDLSACGMSPAEKIRDIRHRTGLSQKAFAARYKIPRRTIENWESGVNTPPAYVINLLEEAVPQ